MCNISEIQSDNSSELNDDELNQVIGGIDYNDGSKIHDNQSIIKSDTDNDDIGSSFSPKNVGGNKCKPYAVPAIIQWQGRMLEGQQAACSDPANKGKKQECQQCSANK